MGAHGMQMNPMMQMQMQMPMMQMQMPMNVQYQMPPHIMQQMMRQQHFQQQPRAQQQQQPESKEAKEDAINTNGTAEMKDDQTVADELSGLRPTQRDVDQINSLMQETASDPKMQNSQFMKFLSDLKNKPPIADEEKFTDQSEAWRQQFQGWNDPSDVDNMNWQSYMEAINPDNAEAKFEYEFADEKYANEEAKTDFFADGVRLMNRGNLNEAILAFEACVKNEPERSEAWRYLGICHADNETENKAIAA